MHLDGLFESSKGSEGHDERTESEGYGVQGFDKELAPVQDSHQDGHLPRRCGQDGVLRLRMQACAPVNSPSGTGEEFFQLAGTLLDVRRAARLRPNNKLSKRLNVPVVNKSRLLLVVPPCLTVSSYTSRVGVDGLLKCRGDPDFHDELVVEKLAGPRDGRLHNVGMASYYQEDDQGGAEAGELSEASGSAQSRTG